MTFSVGNIPYQLLYKKDFSMKKFKQDLNFEFLNVFKGQFCSQGSFSFPQSPAKFYI